MFGLTPGLSFVCSVTPDLAATSHVTAKSSPGPIYTHVLYAVVDDIMCTVRHVWPWQCVRKPQQRHFRLSLRTAALAGPMLIRPHISVFFFFPFSLHLMLRYGERTRKSQAYRFSVYRCLSHTFSSALLSRRLSPLYLLLYSISSTSLPLSGVQS